MSNQKPGGLTKLKDKFKDGSLRVLKKKPVSPRKTSVEKQQPPPRDKKPTSTVLPKRSGRAKLAKRSNSKEATKAKDGKKKISVRTTLAAKFKDMSLAPKVTKVKTKKRNSKEKSGSSDGSDEEGEGEEGEGGGGGGAAGGGGEEEDGPSMPEMTVDNNNPFFPGDRKIQPGDVRNVVHVENYLLKMIAAERPDIDTSQLTEEDAVRLDTHLRGRTELIAGDCIYIEDDLDEDERNYVRYEIGAKWAEGRYSSIYLATRTCCIDNVATPDAECYLIKVALRKNGARSAQRLKNEGRILLDVGNRRLEANKMLFTPIQIDQGTICDLPYLVMNYLDRNLAKIREDCGGRFRKPTAVFAAIECLNTVADFHGRNYVHRDIKLANFCGGILDLRQKLFLIDFGDAIKKTDLNPPPLGVPDGLTLPYWSLQAHAEGSVSQRGDLESWFYLAVDLIEPEAFTWSRETKISASVEKKKQFWEDYKTVLKSPKLVQIADILAQKKEVSFPKDHMAVRQKLKEMLDSLTKGKFVVDWVQPRTVGKSKIQPMSKR